MFQKFYPDLYISSTYEIDFDRLYRDGYRGLIFDIDNTLVPHGAPADDRAKELFSRLHGLGMKTALVSNNGEERVRPFAEEVESIYLYKAGKPKRDGYEKAMQRMGTDTENTLFVGDQIFTDIFGGNRAGLDTVLTEPVDKSTDEPQIVVKRWFEKPFRKVRRDF